MRKHAFAALGLALALVLTLSACGNGSSSSGSTSALPDFDPSSISVPEGYEQITAENAAQVWGNPLGTQHIAIVIDVQSKTTTNDKDTVKGVLSDNPEYLVQLDLEYTTGVEEGNRIKVTGHCTDRTTDGYLHIAAENIQVLNPNLDQ